MTLIHLYLQQILKNGRNFILLWYFDYKVYIVVNRLENGQAKNSHQAST